LNKYDEHTAPPEWTLKFGSGNEDSGPIDQNGNLDEWENGRVAASVDENKLELSVGGHNYWTKVYT
jgi:hypothetical protein